MDTPAVGDLSLRDELRLHARYIRDTLVPILSRQYKLTHSDNVLLRSIFKKLDSTHITLPLLRYSRMEKALMVIAATGASTVILVHESHPAPRSSKVNHSLERRLMSEYGSGRWKWLRRPKV